MSREILFRGKRSDNGEWVEGDLIHDNVSGICIQQSYRDPILVHPVDPETICQYTGLEDIKGNFIYDGDILEAQFKDGREKYVVRIVAKWILFGWYLCEDDNLPDEIDESDIGIWTVCGNVFDNPELLEGGAGDV